MSPMSHILEVMSVCDNREFHLCILHLLLFELTTSFPIKIHLHLLPLQLWYSLYLVIEVACCCQNTSIALGKLKCMSFLNTLERGNKVHKSKSKHQYFSMQICTHVRGCPVCPVIVLQRVGPTILCLLIIDCSPKKAL